jgi:gamma-glutamyltranspeptidase/glutathione hydrolase
MRNSGPIGLLASLLLALPLPAAAAPLRAALATADAEATRVGADLLRAGGNAADAAVGAALALAVVLTTLNDLYGSACWVPGAGILLNGEMDDFTIAPGRPNLFGRIQGEGNRVVPGDRPLSSMAPMILTRAGALVAISGRGDSRIPSTVTQVLLDLFDLESPAAAVTRPRLHHQGLPDRHKAEARALSHPVADELRRRGHEIVAPASRAKVSLARRLATGDAEAGANPRTAEVAAGVELPPASGGA